MASLAGEIAGKKILARVDTLREVEHRVVQ
jgi:hypothetical protein